MWTENIARHVDRRIAELAASQHGVVSGRQLSRIGVSNHQLAHRLATRRLHRLHRGVFLVGTGTPTREGRLLAAVLACGEGAVLSHQAAGDEWGLRLWSGRRIHVTVPTPVRRRTPGIVVHRSSNLPPNEVTRQGVIPVTTVPRTLLDLASLLPRSQLERAVHRAEVLRIFDLGAVEAVLGAHPRRAGTPRSPQ